MCCHEAILYMEVLRYQYYLSANDLVLWFVILTCLDSHCVSGADVNVLEKFENEHDKNICACGICLTLAVDSINFKLPGRKGINCIQAFTLEKLFMHF